MHPHHALPEITVDELDRARGHATADAPLVLDVREHWEYRDGRVPGALHIPLGELVARVNEVPRDRPIAVICGHGQRSLGATEFLLRSGYEDVASVAGGTVAWATSGREIERGE